jgi:GntR family transcriptional regulator
LFKGISLSGTAPIYEQLIEKIEYMVLKGVFEPNDPLPSVRELASYLAVNPNTIQKAYSELERRGVTYSVSGKGRFVTDNIEKILQAKAEGILGDIKNRLLALKVLGVPKEDITKRIDDIWGCKND